MLATLIGRLNVYESFEVTQHHQYAAYYTVHSVQPGMYSVYCESRYPEVQGRDPWPYYIRVTYDTVIVHDYPDPDRIGQGSQHTIRPYAYQCPSVLAERDTDAEWLGGQFISEPGMQFCTAWGRDGVVPIITREHLPATFREDDLPAR